MSTTTIEPPAQTRPTKVTLRTLRQWAKAGQTFAMLTCYDALTAGWLWRGGVQTMLVGDTAAQVILGHDSTLPATMPFMLDITAAVRRGAPQAFVMADMPFGSYQCGDDEAVRNAIAFLKEAGADAVKLEVDTAHAELVRRMADAGVPVVAHVGSRPQQVRAQGGYRSAGRTRREAEALVDCATLMIDRGAAMLLVEAVPAEVSARIVEQAHSPRTGLVTPVIGCGGGPACHGHVVVLHDLLGMTDWQPPFARPMADAGHLLERLASDWVEKIRSGAYLRDDHPYTLQD